MAQNAYCDGFPVHHFARNYTHNSITKVIQARFSYRTIAPISEISILLVRAVCEIRLASYESKEGMQLFSDTPFRAYLHL